MRLVVLFLLAFLQLDQARAGEVQVYAAASLKTALDEVSALWLKETGNKATAIYAASNVLAKQIMEGAPADVFISADLAWMDELQSKDAIRSETRTNILGNTLVLIAPAGSGLRVELKPGADILGLLKGGRLATGETVSVPAGRYAKAALRSLGLWEKLEPRLAMQVNVRAALVLVARGEAPLGIVYASDARAEPGVEAVATFPENSHPPIVYPAAIVSASQSPGAQAFLDFLVAERATAIFEASGFLSLK